MPAGVGYKDDRDGVHNKIVAEVKEWEEQQFRALTPTFGKVSGFHKLWLGERKDLRKPTERWRSNSWIPEPFSAEQTKTAALLELFNAQDPPWHAQGVGGEDQPKARAFERTLDYVLRGNLWASKQESLFRGMGIQGFVVLKPGWREQTWTITSRPTQQQRAAFDVAVNQAVGMGVPNPQAGMDQAGWEAWHQSAKMVYPQLPPLPAPGPHTIVQYRGPWLNEPSVFDLRFDPFIADWSEQPRVIHRLLKTKQWVLEQVRAGVYDEKQVEAGLRAVEDKGISTWEAAIHTAIGLTYDPENPAHRDLQEIWEVWETNSKFPHMVILNRCAIVNVRPDQHPYWHRQLPFIPMRNVPFYRLAHGMSDYQQLEKTFADRLTFRDLLLDALILSVMPIFLKSRTLGLGDGMRSIFPGLIVDVNDVNGWKAGWQAPQGFAELIKIGELLRSDEDDTLALWGNVRGQQATVGRVSATESSGRMNQALVRQKQQVIRLEDEFSLAIPQMFSLMNQKWPEEDQELAWLKKRVVGDDAESVFKGVNREDFVEALNMDIRFRGASRTIDKALQAQQLSDWLSRAAGIQLAPGISALMPSEIRAALRRIAETLGQKNVAADLVSAAGDEIQDAAYQLTRTNLSLQNVQAQQALQAAQNPQPAPAGQPPSESLNYKDAPEDIKRQIETQAGLQPSQLPPPVAVPPGFPKEGV
jgi:hypothetical protein